MRKVLKFLLWTALVLGIIVGVARATAIRWWRIPTGDPILEASLAPTLRGGDLVLLWRLTKPSFGDLVVCPDPEAPDRVVIGRLIGEEGDTVATDDQKVFLNSKPAQTERACGDFEVADPTTGASVRQLCEIEVISGHSHKSGLVAGISRMAPVPIKKEVGPGHVFLLSDNRTYPYDSRDFGNVDRATCRETIVFRIVGQGGYADVEARFSVIQ
jgi:signal peptidase I